LESEDFNLWQKLNSFKQKSPQNTIFKERMAAGRKIAG